MISDYESVNHTTLIKFRETFNIFWVCTTRNPNMNPIYMQIVLIFKENAVFVIEVGENFPCSAAL